MRAAICVLYLGALGVVFVFITPGCSGEQNPPTDIVYTGSSFPTFKSRGFRAPALSHPPPAVTPLPEGAVPWAGTVSHHLLTAGLIDAWFAELRQSRDVKLFILISPRHWGQGVREISLSGLPWDSGDGEVTVAREPLERLKQALDIGEDPTAFPGEHGIDTLIPFIHRFFPTVEILPIVIAMDNPNVEICTRLADALEFLFTGSEADRCFLLISADFSHRGDSEITTRNDTASRRFLENLSPDTWCTSVSDNKSGLLVLTRLAAAINRRQVSIFLHTDSFQLTGQGPDDITSYFFSFVY